MRSNAFLMSHEELFADGPKRIAIFMDGLTSDEAKAATNFIHELVNEGKVHRPGFDYSKEEISLSVGYTLHECLLRYPYGGSEIPEEKRLKNGMATEFIRLITADEVWVFDKGDNYLYEGRLNNRVKSMMIPIRCLCRTDDGSWGFYRGMDIAIDKENDTATEDWFLIGEEEPYIPTDDGIDIPQGEPESKFYRSYSRECMSEREYAIAKRALLINARTSALAIHAMVKQDDELNKKAGKLMTEGNRIFIKMQSEAHLTDEVLRTFEAQLDFIEADIEELS